MFIVPERLYRTEGGVLVRHGDPAAAFLAFPAGTELSDEEATRHGLVAFFAVKAKDAPENKMVARPADKAGARQPVKEDSP